METISYDVRIYKTEVYKGTKVTTHTVRWSVAGRPWKQGFRTAAQADAFRAELTTAARRGQAFDPATGRPLAWGRAADMSWYDFACAYVDLKWKAAAAKYRRDIARALTAATPAMLATTRGKPDDADIRAALRWGLNTKTRPHTPPQAARVLRWLARHTKPVSALADPKLTRLVLEAAATRLDGTPAAASTVRRHRAILHNACEYAVELGLLAKNPVKPLKWKAPKTVQEVDRRSVVNPTQARRLLEAVRAQHPSGPRLVAFFALIYYAALRPEEAVNLRVDNITLPADGDDWGELHFCHATPDVGRAWTDDGAYRERRPLKARPAGAWRHVPTPPPLTRLLRTHLATFGAGPSGRVFTGVRGGELASSTYRRAWAAARKATLTPAEYASPLARHIYDLRHACVSTWLNAGVPPTQVAEWAGHSVAVLLHVYAKCIDGQHETAKRRIETALHD